MTSEPILPTFRQLMKSYSSIVLIERMKTGKPNELTVANVLRGTTAVCRAAGVSLDSTVDVLTRPRIDQAIAEFMRQKFSRVTVWSYLGQLQGLFARWCRPYYADANWTIPPLELPVFHARAPRYERPSDELLAQVKTWYRQLKDEYWFVATMMLEFAMRNGDVLRMTDENFVVRNGRCYLSYTPNKTKNSSGRDVFWPVHEDIRAIINAHGGVESFDVTDATFAALNRQLRALGFHGQKGCYELRKISIDHIYQRFGAEMAVSLSGDDIRTISHYYADPAQPNVDSLRVSDLL